MRSVVTGAAGFAGSRLARLLLDRGHEVLGIDRLSDHYDPALKRRRLDELDRAERFETLVADLNELDLGALLQGADYVFHLAAQPGVRSSWGAEFDVYLADNVLATQRLLEGMRTSGSGRLVMASSSSVYGEAEDHPTPESAVARPISPYGVSKLGAEHLCRLYSHQFGVDFVILRYFTVFGPSQRPDMAFARFIDAALTGRPIEILGDGRQVRDFTYIDDALAVTLAAASSGRSGRIYNVAGGARATVLEVIDLLERELGGPIPVRHLPVAAGDVRRTSGDISLARRELGYRPSVSLAEGLRAQFEARADHAPAAGAAS